MRAIVALGVAVAVLASIAWTWIDGPRGRLALAVVIGAAAAVICVIVVLSHRSLTRVLRRIERQAAANHKKASTWTYRIEQVLGDRVGGGVQRYGASDVPTVTVPAVSVAVPALSAEAKALARSGILDVELYAAVTGGGWQTAESAASDFLRNAAPKGASPHPLLDLASLPEVARRSLRQGVVKPLLAFLSSPEAMARPLSVLFDGSAAGVDPAAAAKHPGGVLGAWLKSADAASPLPLPETSWMRGATLRSVRSALVAHASEVRDLMVPPPQRDRSTWDTSAETDWISKLRAESPEPPTHVTVIMPVRDRVGVVGDAIASVQAQTTANWQLIVVDDGSTDGTRELLEHLAATDDRLLVLDNPGHGVAAARNAGLLAADAPLIAFLDSDNTWAPHFLEVTARAMRRDRIRAAYSASAIHDDDGSVVYRAMQAGVEQLRLRNHIDLNVLVVDRALIDGGVHFDETLRRWVDHDFALKVAARTEPVLLPFVGCHYTHSETATDRITVRESEHWQWVALERYWAEWENASPAVAGRISVVIPTFNDADMTAKAVASVLDDAAASGIDLEVQLVDNGSRIDVGQRLLAGVAASPRVHYCRLPRNMNFAIGCNVGAVRATGEYTLFLNNDTFVRPGVLTKLLAALGPGVVGVQPLLVYDDETIQTAGTVFTAAESLPSHMLVGHPKEDALELGDVEFDAVSAAALMMRTDHVRQLRGFDAIFVNGMEDVDFCLRARRDLGGRFALVPNAVVTHLESKTPGRGARVDENRRLFLDRWRGALPAPQHEIFLRAGFSIAYVGSDGRDIPGPRPVIVRDPADTRTRWGIRIAAIPGAAGDVWGDTHFAESLRLALEELGHRAVVHRHGAHMTPVAGMDDVVLVLRGLDRVRPMPGKRNILWVISHPDKVTIDELREFDRVFAASSLWAERMTTESGRMVEPMLQATDPARFNTDIEPLPIGKPLFVGKHFPTRDRPLVRDALRAGIDLAVYGPEWEGQLPEGVLRGSWIDNDRLAGAYRGATRVLADHWPSMAAEGFLQNRLFDAVAAGCRVISDAVPGVDDYFEGAVRTYSTPTDLAALCEDDSAFPGDDAMRDIAERVRKKHSFRSRAMSLIDAAGQTGQPAGNNV